MTVPAARTPAPIGGAGSDRGQLPFVPQRGRLQPLGTGAVRIDDGFWAHLQQLNAGTMLQHCEDWIERSGWSGNFDAAAEGRLPSDRRGREFSDSEVYKLLEAMSWEVGRTGDAAVEKRLQALTARVARAQEPDGYLNTMFGRPGQAPRWSDLEWGHELYCAGHLLQAGVARLRTGVDDELVAVARRVADHVCDVFGPEGDQRIDGHPEIEVALVELARATGEQRYLDQARLFLERRGHGVLGEIDFGPQYFQDDVPIREADVHRGHAVRALYLASAAVDLAAEDADDELLEAVRAQTLTTLARRTYLTGGMGAHHEGESFGQDYELPSDRAYSETCAGIASVMLNHRLLLATGDARHADAVERTLYNVVATSPAEDGRAFFYTNPLQQREPGNEPALEEASPRAASSLRAPWYAVSCCPTNLTRTLASLDAYLATTDPEGVQLHQYAAGRVEAPLSDGSRVALEIRTEYPADGLVTVEVIEAPGTEWTLSLRVPGWAESADLAVDGDERVVSAGYVHERRAFAVGDVVTLRLPVRARWTWPDPRVDALRGQVAVERGPVVLCLESPDLGGDVGVSVVDAGAAPVERDGEVLVPVALRRLDEPAWPYGASPAPAGTVDDGAFGLVPLVPYHRWANRGPATMRVWMPTAG